MHVQCKIVETLLLKFVNVSVQYSVAIAPMAAKCTHAPNECDPFASASRSWCCAKNHWEEKFRSSSDRFSKRRISGDALKKNV